MPPSSALLLAPDIRALATALDLHPSKARGQNFVIDPNTVRKIVSQAGLGEHTHVLEVGPGFGSLTLGMLEAGHKVTAIEIDSRMASLLPQTVAARIPGAQFRVIEADALTVDSLDSGLTPDDSRGTGRGWPAGSWLVSLTCSEPESAGSRLWSLQD